MEGRIFGQYRVTHKLSQGGMADVWTAQHKLSGAQAVVKLLKPEMVPQEQLLKRFFQEARAAAKIQDPGVVKIIDVDRASDGTAYLVLEKLTGESLGDRLKQRGTLTVEQTVAWMRQLARAMGAAHAQRIVHRDLKPCDANQNGPTSARQNGATCADR
ncbi:MAG: serine/threonine protein kinase [Proteobacteria bacterium]|nr:serine/threonine protein kinase [Pseudomonadota bacterium]